MDILALTKHRLISVWVCDECGRLKRKAQDSLHVGNTGIECGEFGRRGGGGGSAACFSHNQHILVSQFLSRRSCGKVHVTLEVPNNLVSHIRCLTLLLDSWLELPGVRLVLSLRFHNGAHQDTFIGHK